MNDEIFPNVASELFEIFKYLNDEILNKIPIELKNHIHDIRNLDYKFEIEKDKPLIDQKLLLETKQILSVIFLKYCCTNDEVSEILGEHINIQNEIDDSKLGIESLEKFFNKNLKNYDSNIESTDIVKIEEIPWYKKLLNKMKKFFKIG